MHTSQYVICHIYILRLDLAGGLSGLSGVGGGILVLCLWTMCAGFSGNLFLAATAAE